VTASSWHRLEFPDGQTSDGWRSAPCRKGCPALQTESLADAQPASCHQQRKLILWLLEFAEHFEGVFDLQNVGQLIARCWIEAEEETSKVVNEKYWSPGEEDITFIFAGELRSKLKKVSDGGAVEDAFIRDLEESIPFHRFPLDPNLVRLSRGLIARVNFHNRAHEGRKSAADLGIAIRRPLVRFEPYSMQVETDPEHATGLLAQAKLGLRQQKVPTHKWGKLTDQQVALFPKRRGYSSLLLYRLAGRGANELKHFRWQFCKRLHSAASQEMVAFGLVPGRSGLLERDAESDCSEHRH
jgi:hypothetical protein